MYAEQLVDHSNHFRSRAGITPSSMVLRPGVADDAGRCGQYCFQAFKSIAERHGYQPDFPSPEAAIGMMSSLLARSDVYSVVAEADGQILGSNFLWGGQTMAAVGPITVNPELQDNHVGRALMEWVLAKAGELRYPGVRLVQAAYHNRSLALYTKLGFNAREPLSIMQGPPVAKEFPLHQIRKATRFDQPACNDLCRRIHGFDRWVELKTAIAEDTVNVVIRGNRITGYATQIGFFGHAVGESNDDLIALIAAAPCFTGLGFLLPTRNSELMRWCLDHGLRVVQPMTLMSMGQYSEPNGAFLPSILY